MDIGTDEVARRLGLNREYVCQLAQLVDPEDRKQVNAALRGRRLPGRKVGSVWVFRVAHVERFAQLDRPAGRPRKFAAA